MNVPLSGQRTSENGNHPRSARCRERDIPATCKADLNCLSRDLSFEFFQDVSPVPQVLDDFLYRMALKHRSFGAFHEHARLPPHEFQRETLRNGVEIARAGFVYMHLGYQRAFLSNFLRFSANSVLAMKERGADLRTALACRALIHRLAPYN